MENTKPFWRSTKGIIIIIAVIVLLYVGTSYNSLVNLNEGIDGQWAQVEVQYQRRLDLIPNLIASVKGAFGQEQNIIKAVTDARTQYAGAKTVNEKVQAANNVESSISRLLVTVEAYPNLKSLEVVQNFTVDLTGTENRVSVERQRFNDSVKIYNVKVKRFPSSLVAGIFGFDERAYFAADEGADKAPKVNF